MSITSIPVEEVYDPETCSKLRQFFNRTSGGIELRFVRRLITDVLKSQGKEDIVIPSEAYRSVYRPEMMDEPMKKFLAPKVFTPDRQRLKSAISRVRRKLKAMGRVTPVTLDDAYLELISTKENNFAGLPTWGRKRDDKDALQRAIQCWRGKCPPPAVLGRRGKNTEVVRAVWMFPFEWHICEGCFFFPLQESFKQKVHIYAASNAVVRRAVFNEAVASGEFHSKLAMDYSGYDGSIGTQLIGIAFQLLSEHLDLTDKERAVWNRVATYFATCPFIDQHGNLVTGRRGGVPSGSMFTQMIDSIVNAIVLEYVLADEVGYRYYVYGDDSLTFLRGSVDDTTKKLEQLRLRAGELGVRVNLEKTHVCGPGDVTVFLGHYDLVRGRPLTEVLTRLVFPERSFEINAEALRMRVVSYMAESDEAIGVLMPVVRILTALGDRKDVRVNVQSFAEWGPKGFTHVELGRVNPRNLSGLAQYLTNEDPILASAYMRIRAAV